MRFPIPFKDLLPVEAIKQLSQLVSQPTLVNAIKEAAQKIGLKDQFQSGNIQQILQQAGRWMESVSDPWLRDARPGLVPGINATGELFSSRWCTHRLCPDAIAQVNHLQSRYAETSKLDQQLRNLLIGLTSAEAVLIVPSTTTALTVLALANSSSKTPMHWVLPRVDCVRLPQAGVTQGGNVRAILDQANARTTEIGTNQDCTHLDFMNALQEANARLLLASPNSLSAEARTEHRNRALSAAKQNDACVTQIMLDGAIHELSGMGLSSKVIANSWEEGIDWIVVPGDAYLGGPECGIILGKLNSMESVSKIADALGLHASSLTKAAMLRTLQAAESFEQWRQLPIGASLSTSLENLQNRAARLVTQLATNPAFERVVTASKACRIGAGVWSGQRIESSILQLFPKSISSSALAEQLAGGEIPIWTNVQSDHVEFVMRSIEPDEDRLIIKQLNPAID